jgi:hypothetical protein
VEKKTFLWGGYRKRMAKDLLKKGMLAFDKVRKKEWVSQKFPSHVVPTTVYVLVLLQAWVMIT